MKALEILKKIKNNKNYCDNCDGLDYCNNFNSNKLCELNLCVQEAIAELEEAMKPKTCDGCVYFRDDRQCWIENINNYLTCKRHTFELPMVDRYKPNDNA